MLVGVLASACGTTPYGAMLAAFAATVSAEIGTADVLVGAPVSFREQEAHFGLIGMFGNTVVHRLDVSAGQTFRDLVLLAHDEIRTALTYQAYPFELLVRDLNPPRDAGVNPLFQLMFTYQQAPQPGLRLDGCQVTKKFGHTHRQGRHVVVAHS